jgi:hypothetical protein
MITTIEAENTQLQEELSKAKTPTAASSEEQST